MKIKAISILILCGLASAASAQTTTWTGDAADNLWATDGNWDNGVPQANETAVIGAGAVINGGPGLLPSGITVNQNGGTITNGTNNLVVNGTGKVWNANGVPST